MKAFFAFLAVMFLALPAWAVDVQMGNNGQLVFEPNEITISAGDSIHFINNVLPPHNVVVDGHPELSHTGLAFAPGESFDISFDVPGEYTFWCDPHKSAGMTGHITVN